MGGIDGDLHVLRTARTPTITVYVDDIDASLVRLLIALFDSSSE